MNKTKKKLLALLTALAMVLQWTPVLAEGEPTVTVEGSNVTVTAGDTETINVSTRILVTHKDGDVFIENGRVYRWSEEKNAGELVKDDNGDPVDPALYEGVIAPGEHVTSTSVTIDGQFVPLTNEEGQSPEIIDSLTVDAEDVSTEGTGNETDAHLSFRFMDLYATGRHRHSRRAAT